MSVCLSNTRTAVLPVSRRQATFAKSDTNTKWAKKTGPQTHDHNSIKSYFLPISEILSLEDSFNKSAVKWTLKLPSHLAHVAILPFGTLMPAKQAINDKLQGVRCGC